MATVEHALFCFEVLDAELKNRTPMTLYQVQASWADYPKGLEASTSAEVEEPDSSSEAEAASDDDDDEPAPIATITKDSTSTKAPKNASASNLLSIPRSANSTPSTNSTSSLAQSTSTAASSTTSFTPVGLSPKRTSQRTTVTESPLFVTWNTNDPFPNTLRGCIGTFDTLPLSSGIASYSITAALHDTRFSPITLSELPKLSASVTLLTDFETCDDPMDWEIGVHGIKITFYHHHRRYGSTYLPDVCVEQGWTKEECLVSLMRKAGWVGRKEKWAEVSGLKVVRYQGKAESVDWEEFRRWKDWVDGKK